MANHDDNPNAEILLEFVAESRETLLRVEPLLSELERCTAQSDTLAVVFRCFHSFEGTAAFLQLSHTAQLAGSAESLLDLFRRGAQIRSEHVGALRRALDTFGTVLDCVEREYTDRPSAATCAEMSLVIDELVDDIVSVAGPGVLSSRRWRARSEAKRAATRGHVVLDDEPDFFFQTEAAPPTAALPEELLVRFMAESDEHLAKIEEVLVSLERGWASAEQIADAFRALHSFKGNCGICGYADMERLSHRAETIVGQFRDKSRSPDDPSVTALLECLDVLRAALSTLPGGDGKISALPSVLERLDGLSTGKPRALPIGPVDERPQDGVAAELGSARGGGSIRVDTKKLDELMDLVGELIIAETTVTRNPDLEGHQFENFQKAAINLSRLTRALQDLTMTLRMVPIAATFRKMARLVRDVSTKQRKRVELIVTGQDTEVDKTVIETIGDPLVHLIRNSIDHGIEASEERAQGTKGATGRIWLDARHQGGEVWISVRDDGRGLDPERIMKRALDRGLADASRRYTEREIFEFIFEPGFTTTSKVTELSGRGVGLDVVRRNVEGINGRVDVVSEPTHGATFTLRIPLTLAIIEGMLVRVGRAYYTIPMLSIRESVKAGTADITHLSDGTELLKLRRRHYPIIKVGQLHGVDGAGGSARDGILVILESGDRLACVLVDEVVGQRQTVIKPLPEYLKRIRGLAGCAILHNGDISLILDVEATVGTATGRAA